MVVATKLQSSLEVNVLVLLKTTELGDTAGEQQDEVQEAI